MDSLVSTDWLAGALGAEDLVVLDASMHLPAAGRDARSEYAAGHIPGAGFLDLASLRDTGSPLPNTLPTADQFAARMAALGVGRSSRVVLYDDSDIRTAARAWFVLRMNGLRQIGLLDGGLDKWRAEGRPLDTAEEPPGDVERETAAADWSRVRTKSDMLANLSSNAEQVIDARDPGRFTAATSDAVHGLAGGHIPGARNLYYRDLYNPDGTFRSESELRDAFEQAGIDLKQPIVTSCGSGVTAAVLLFALHRLGIDDAALYDGSWSEWGADPATPKESGAAR
jgi:thiosulfate/3-mercaptopyruvate sulfurtransferase